MTLGTWDPALGDTLPTSAHLPTLLPTTRCVLPTLAESLRVQQWCLSTPMELEARLTCIIMRLLACLGPLVKLMPIFAVHLVPVDATHETVLCCGWTAMQQRTSMPRDLCFAGEPVAADVPSHTPLCSHPRFVPPPHSPQCKRRLTHSFHSLTHQTLLQLPLVSHPFDRQPTSPSLLRHNRQPRNLASLIKALCAARCILYSHCG